MWTLGEIILELIGEILDGIDYRRKKRKQKKFFDKHAVPPHPDLKKMEW